MATKNYFGVKHPGAFTAEAKAAGKSVHEYAVENQHAPGLLGQRARLALTFEGMAHSNTKAIVRRLKGSK